jgi:hypothetical protein
MDKRHRLSAKNKTDLMPKNASCKSWDTPVLWTLKLLNSQHFHREWTRKPHEHTLNSEIGKARFVHIAGQCPVKALYTQWLADMHPAL